MSNSLTTTTTTKAHQGPPTVDILFELVPDTYLTAPCRFILHLLRQLGSVSCHPYSSFGYYCSYPTYASSLITFLADPMECPINSWNKYRTEISTQLSYCSNCIIKHHHQVVIWKNHPTTQSYSLDRMNDMRRSLGDFDAERVSQALRDGSIRPQGSSRSNSLTTLRSKNAFFEILISIRLSMQNKVTRLLPAVFLRQYPIDDDDLKDFFSKLGYLPPGLISLCFHPKQVVRDWAVKIINRFASKIELQDKPTIYILGRVLASLRRSLGLERTPNESWEPTSFDRLDAHGFILSFAKILPLLSEDALICILTLNKGSAAKILSMGLALKNEEEVVRHAAETLVSIMHRTSFDTIFHGEYMSVDKFINDLLTLLGDALQTATERKHLFNLAKHVLLQGRNRLGNAAVLRLHDKTFSALEQAMTNTKKNRRSVSIKKSMRSGIRSTPRTIKKSGGSMSARVGTVSGKSGKAVMNNVEKLKTERRKDLQNTRSIGPGGRKSVAIPDIIILDPPTGSPAPTKFELIREKHKSKFAGKRKRSEREEPLELKKKKIGGERKLDISRQKDIDVVEIIDLTTLPDKVPSTRVSASNIVIPTPFRENYSVPQVRRYANCGTVESVYSSFINGRGSFEGADRRHNYEKSRGNSFRNVAEYVFFWEPLLREELHASVEAARKDEEGYFAKNGEPCRLHFQVLRSEASGNDHIIDVRYDLWKLRNLRYDDAGDQFHPIKAKPNDIMLVTPITQSEHPCTPNKSSLALVMKMSQERGQVLLKLKIGLDNRSEILPAGHLVSVSRLTSLITFQRQIEALYDLEKLPDGLLWPILEPKVGWAKNDGAMRKVDESCGAKLKAPRQFIDSMVESRELNESQAKAIRAVVGSCGPIFTSPGGVSKGPYSDHGGITLIQGPPGTGKTSTIVGMLSTLLFATVSKSQERKVVFDVKGGERHEMTIPPVRILVCAPSNAAVDEIMGRVVEHGLKTPWGSRACPRVVRLGAGSTSEELKRLELRRMTGIDEKVSNFDEALDEYEKNKKEKMEKLRVINDEISFADRKKKVLRAQLDEIVSFRGKVENEKRRIEDEEKTYWEWKDVSTNLTNLHSRKNAMKGYIWDDQDLKKVLEEKKRREQDLKMARVLNNAVIVFSTLNSSGNEFVKRLGAPFDVTIVDEAAQCVEPDVLIAATVGRRAAGNIGHSHLVMVGDPKQLPATVLSENGVVSSRLGCSMFERFSESSPDTVHMLDTQYRMHPKISLFPSRWFYGGLLKNGDSVLSEEAMKKPFHEDSRGRFGPLTFIDTKDAGFREKHNARGSASNTSEACMIVSAIVSMVRLYSCIDFKDKIAVLTPYREQVEMFKNMLKRTKALDGVAVEVNTVDGIQGREKPVVFLSTVRGVNAKSIGFLRDLRRMNVAITRAKHSVIIVGNSEMLSENDETWKSLVGHCKEEGVLLEATLQDAELFPESSWNWKCGVPPQQNCRTQQANNNGYIQKERLQDAEALKNEYGSGLVFVNEGLLGVVPVRKRLRSALPEDVVAPAAKRYCARNEARGTGIESVYNGKQRSSRTSICSPLVGRKRGSADLAGIAVDPQRSVRKKMETSTMVNKSTEVRGSSQEVRNGGRIEEGEGHRWDGDNRHHLHRQGRKEPVTQHGGADRNCNRSDWVRGQGGYKDMGSGSARVNNGWHGRKERYGSYPRRVEDRPRYGTNGARGAGFRR